MRIRQDKRTSFRRNAAGMTLIELMIAMLLGLLVVGAAGGMFLANKRVYGSTETVNRIQENSRASFEIMSRDVREAGSQPCGPTVVATNNLTATGSPWWQDFRQGLRGYEGTVAAPGTAAGSAAAQRVDGTDAVDLHMANDGEYQVVEHALPGDALELDNTAGLMANGFVLACNAGNAAIFQITAVSGNNVEHAASGAPGNASTELQGPAGGLCMRGGSDITRCLNLNPQPGGGFSNSTNPAVLTRLQSVRWYIGNNDRGGTSLYRAVLVNTGSTGAPTNIVPSEVAEGVSDMQLEYRSSGSTAYQSADTVGDWSQVNAVRIRLVFQGAEGALSKSDIRGTDGDEIDREMIHVVALRSREVSL